MLIARDTKPGICAGRAACLTTRFFAAASILGGATGPGLGAEYVSSSVVPPAPLREFRAAWVATVNNINWPSKPGLSTAVQKRELVAILDRAAQLKLNAIIFQVRPACDAMYASKLEPWSEYLTGRMGQAPAPFYDPLEFAVTEAHQRGLELHAWFNPYRALHASGKSPVASNHVSRTHPELVRRYGQELWLDPGEPGTQEYSLQVVMDVVRRYDIDAVHFDDYFYPYPVTDSAGGERDFPDDTSWKNQGARSGLSRDDWRRENVNAFIRRVYQSVHAAKPWVKFGLSPFGIWRPGQPAQIRGLDAYAKLYADSRKWIVNGWADYFAPQLYWAIEPKEQSYPVLLKWWADQNAKNRHLWPGLNSAKVGNGWPGIEIVKQIRLTRKQAGASGHIHWNVNSLLARGNSLSQALAPGVYGQPALVPASPWLGGPAPGKPMISLDGALSGRLRLNWKPSGTDRVWLWVLQTRSGGQWQTEILPSEATGRVLGRAQPEVLAVTAIDRVGNAGPAVVLARREK